MLPILVLWPARFNNSLSLKIFWDRFSCFNLVQLIKMSSVIGIGSDARQDITLCLCSKYILPTKDTDVV